MTPCKICNTPAIPYADVLVRGRHPSTLHACPGCGFVFIDPVYWLDEAYQEVITPSDVGYVWRNCATADFLAHYLRHTAPDDFFVDYGGGYGMLVRMMRDRGFRFHLYEPNAPNLFARFTAADNAHFQYRVLTAVEVFEHLPAPDSTLPLLLDWSHCLLFTTELCPTPRPLPSDWHYIALEHGQHISFYTPQSLSILAARYGLAYRSLAPGWHMMAPLADTLPSRSLRSLLAERFGLRRPPPRQCLLEDDYKTARRIIARDAAGHVDRAPASEANFINPTNDPRRPAA